MRESSSFSSGWLSCWDPRHKLIACLFVMVIAATVQTIAAASLALVLSLTLLIASGISLRELLLRCSATALFLLPCLLILPLTTNGTPVSMYGITISRYGLELALLIYTRALAVIILAMAVLQSTPVPQLLRAAEQFRLPTVLVQIALLSWRYVFSLQREWQRVKDALRTRGFENRSTFTAYNTWASVVGMTLVRSSERTQRICDAMQCRGYRGTLHSLHPFPRYPFDTLKTMMISATGFVLLSVDWVV